MTTPGKPRQSGIPGLGRSTGIPTPGRSRSTSSCNQYSPTVQTDDISRAFADAIKANDPSQHRAIHQSNSTSSASSLSPQTASYSSSGRRSVVGRPSSSASVSSIGASTNKLSDRVKTPTSARTLSRPPSRQSEGIGRQTKAFEVGENVRIESLGFEGKLRYLGEIDGKPGLWAGVQLSGGFSGKGKNNGGVGGKQYFSCPDNCGVFVATTKLSPPTVGVGAAARPPSVASSRGGRTTPAMSGRITPSFTMTRTPSASFSNGRLVPSTGGRITPSLASGRVTPGTTPSTSVRQRALKTPTSKPVAPSLSDKITAGSRASKYMSMTAQQLTSRNRDTENGSPTRTTAETSSVLLSSPTLSRNLSSPTRPPSSPFSTPKAGIGKISLPAGGSPSLPRTRPSFSTPRARIPSAVSMPPPASPRPPSQQAEGDSSAHSNLELNGKAIQEKIAAVTSSFPSSRPPSSVSFRSTGTDELSLIEQLQSRLDAAEYENERLRSATESESSSQNSQQIEHLQAEKQEAIDRFLRLEENLRVSDATLATQMTQFQQLEAYNGHLKTQLDHSTKDTETTRVAHQDQVDALENQLSSMQEELEQHILRNLGQEETITSQKLDNEQFTADMDRLQVDFESEKRLLIAQIDELRVAGQETIALYEERLSIASNERYEMESRISSLETGLRTMAANEQSQDSASQSSSATQIENESLREQVYHLQTRSEKLEEKLEESRAVSEREVMDFREELKALRRDEDQRNREINLKTREVEKLMKSEAGARLRVEEIEEALRESTVALENARGEVETFRVELTNIDILIGDNNDGDIASRIANFTKKSAIDRARYEAEIGNLQRGLQQLQRDRGRSNGAPEGTVNAQNNGLLEHTTSLEERVALLTQQLDEKASEVENLRKKANRDVPVTNGDSTKVTSPKSDPSTVREEVAGLKHIVQDLQKQNLSATQRIKMLESENQLLSSEADQLRQEVHILEENLDHSLRDDHSEESTGSQINTVDSLQRKLKEQSTRLEVDLEQMRKRLNDAEMKHARALHDSNKEISELEALVESKIYREDELEQEVERLREKLTRHKKSSKPSAEAVDGRHRLSSASTSTISSGGGPDVCEICERPGHDIFSCSLLKEDVALKPHDDVFCEDCESPGHVAADCPHSLDVF